MSLEGHPRRVPGRFVLAALPVALASFMPAHSARTAAPKTPPLSADEAGVAWRMNHERYTRKIHTLTVSDSVSGKARAHACEMAKQQTLSESTHPGSEYVDESWTIAGENVGEDSDLYSLHLAWMDSPGHRDNILDWHYDRMGVGVCKDDSGTYWATVIFWGKTHTS